MLAVLIVAFQRLDSLKLILDSSALKGKEIFVFVDKAKIPSVQNSEVIAYLGTWTESGKGHLKISDRNFGVGAAVPAAMDWAFSHVSRLAVLEDDCVPNQHFLDFCEFALDCISDSNETLIVSGTSPFKNNLYASLSDYPLIWGWATTADKWKILRNYIINSPTISDVFIAILRNPKKLKPLAFFAAARIRIKQGRLSAWDSPMTLGMLIEDKTSVVPGMSLITNIGADSLAHHPGVPVFPDSKVISLGTDRDFYRLLKLDLETKNSTNLAIEFSIYKMKKRHVFSPFKAFFRL
jgi:hypothetical protein